MLTFLQGTPEAIHRFERALSRDDGRVYRISTMLQDFIGYLDEHHGRDLAGHDWSAVAASAPVTMPTPAAPGGSASTISIAN